MQSTHYIVPAGGALPTISVAAASYNWPPCEYGRVWCVEVDGRGLHDGTEACASTDRSPTTKQLQARIESEDKQALLSLNLTMLEVCGCFSLDVLARSGVDGGSTRRSLPVSPHVRWLVKFTLHKQNESHEWNAPHHAASTHTC